MTAGTLAAVNAIWLAAGFALVLWGLKIFKFWVGAVGMLAGAFVGAALASVIFGTQEATLAGALGGGLLGALAAWPLQKLVVFGAAGTAMALTVAAGSIAFLGADNVAVASIIGFVAGGLLAMWAYDYVVIAAMAFTGAQAVFHAAYVSFDVYSGRPADIAGRLLGTYALRFPVFVATTLLFLAFSLWYQRGPGRKRDRSPVRHARAIAARRVAVRFAVLIVIAWLFAAALATGGLLPVSTFELVGMHPISWPLVALAALPFVRPRPPAGRTAEGDVSRPPRRIRRRLLRMAVFGVVVPPALTAGLFLFYGERWIALQDFYVAFITGPGPVVAAKWAFSIGLFPILLVRAQPVVIELPEPQPAQPDEEEPGAVGATAGPGVKEGVDSGDASDGQPEAHILEADVDSTVIVAGPTLARSVADETVAGDKTENEQDRPADTAPLSAQ